MTMRDLSAAIDTVGLPFVNGIMKSPDGKQMPAPYIAYHADTSNAIYADGEIVFFEAEIVLALVTKDRDRKTERKIESALTDAGVSYDAPDYAFDLEQDIHTTTWYFQISDD